MVSAAEEDATRPARVLAFVAAHPDDDVMGAVGVVATRRHEPGFRFVLIHATDGDAGEIAAGSGATRATLGAVRREEDRSGWRVVGRQPAARDSATCSRACSPRSAMSSYGSVAVTIPISVWVGPGAIG